jgi:hypothetical protein
MGGGLGLVWDLLWLWGGVGVIGGWSGAWLAALPGGFAGVAAW